MQSSSPTVATSRLAARVIDVVLDEGPYGERITWFLEAKGPHGLVKLRTWSSRSLAPASRMSKWVTAIIGRPPAPRQGLDPVALIGEPCTVLVTPNDNGFLRVLDILPARDEEQ